MLWDKTPDYGNDLILAFYNAFSEPLDQNNFDSKKALREWQQFKVFVQNTYPGFQALSLWKKICLFREIEFPNLVLMAKLMFAISGSNSSVERSFSILTQILSDQRLSVSHETMENIMLIAGNKGNWTDNERDKHIDRAVELYLSKRHSTQLDKVQGSPPHKVVVLDEEGWSSSNNGSDSSTFSED